MQNFISANFKTGPHHLLAIMALLLVAMAFISPNTAIDYKLSNTYKVIGLPQIYLALAGFYAILWVIYLVTNRFLLSPVLTWIHVAGTSLSFIGLFMLVKRFLGLSGMTMRYYALSNFGDHVSDHTFRTPYIIMVAIALTVQPFFLINLFVGAVKRLWPF